MECMQNKQEEIAKNLELQLAPYPRKKNNKSFVRDY